MNRLATLRFLEGDFEDSARLCLRVLHDKPWHFGASSGIVMVYAQMGNADDAKRWALHARTNKHTHTHTHTHSLTHSHKAHTHTYTHMHTCTPTHTHTHTTYSLSLSLSLSHTHTGGRGG